MPLTDKKLDKISKLLGDDTLKELDALSTSDLKSRVVIAEQSIAQAIQELEANPKYQEFKEALKDLSGGLRDVKKRQNAIIAYAIHLLEQGEES